MPTTASSSSRPIKLRSACSQCCSAKIRCSGEKTGCERCRNIGTQCIYLESRVGKVPGIRAKKRRIQSEVMPQPERQPEPSTSQTVFHQTAPAILSPLSLDLAETTQNQPMSWTTTASQFDSSDSNSEFLNSYTSSAADSTDTSITTDSTNEDFSMPMLDFNLDDIWNSPAPTHLGSPTSLPPPQPLIQSQTPAVVQADRGKERQLRNERVSHCVVQCCQLVSDLENYIMADMKAFQILIGIVRKAQEKLLNLLTMQQSSPNLRCLMMFNTIFYQILELLDTCQQAMNTPNQRPQSSSVLMPDGLGSFGFGDFGFDEEEQSAWRMRRVLKEVQQGAEILRRIKALAGDIPKASVPNSSAQSNAREHCYRDLETRLKDVASKIVVDR